MLECSFAICATQLTEGVLLKMLKHVKVTLNIF